MTININGTTGISGVDGSAGTPAIQGSDTNTGVFFGTNTIDLSTDGTSRLSIGADGDLNVDSGTLFVDASENRVGIGTTSPARPLDVVSDSGARGIQVRGRSSDNIGLIDFHSNDGATRYATIGAPAASQFAIETGNTEKLRIDGSGNLGLNETTPSDFNDAGTGGVNLVVGATGAGRGVLTFASEQTGGENEPLGIINFTDSDTTNTSSRSSRILGMRGPDANSSYLLFQTANSGNPATHITIERNGNVFFSNVPNAVYPATDNAFNLGASGVRWSAVWAANGSIQTSDERTKTEITDSVLGTDFIKSLRPVSYKWINGGNVDTGEREENGNFIYTASPGKRRHWGFLAQEVKQSVDAAGVDFGGWLLTDKDDPDSEQALRYDQFIAPLTKALQEAITKIETLEARLSVLEGGAN